MTRLFIVIFLFFIYSFSDSSTDICFKKLKLNLIDDGSYSFENPILNAVSIKYVLKKLAEKKTHAYIFIY